MLTLIDLPDTQIQALAVLCERTEQSKAAVIREALSEYLERLTTKPIETAFGLWDSEAMDDLAYQETVRAEWKPHCSTQTSR